MYAFPLKTQIKIHAFNIDECRSCGIKTVIFLYGYNYGSCRMDGFAYVDTLSLSTHCVQSKAQTLFIDEAEFSISVFQPSAPLYPLSAACSNYTQ